MNDMYEWSSYDGAIDKSKTTKDWAHMMGYYLEKIATAIGKKKISPHLVATTEQFLKDDKWEKRAAALIGWTVVGKNFREGRMISLVNFAMGVLCDTHPRVRYYSIYLLDSLFRRNDLNDHQDRFEKVLTALIPNLSDPIIRVRNKTVDALAKLLLIGECPDKNILAANYDAIVPILISTMEKWEPYEDVCQFSSTNTMIVISSFADAAGKDRFKVHFKKVTSLIVTIFRSMDVFITPLAFSVNRICRVMGSECITLLRLVSFKIDLNINGHHFLRTLIKAVHTDNFDGSAETIKEEQKLAHYVKKFSMDEESVEWAKKSMSEEEKETLKRMLSYE